MEKAARFLLYFDLDKELLRVLLKEKPEVKNLLGALENSDRTLEIDALCGAIVMCKLFSA